MSGTLNFIHKFLGHHSLAICIVARAEKYKVAKMMHRKPEMYSRRPQNKTWPHWYLAILSSKMGKEIDYLGTENMERASEQLEQ